MKAVSINEMKELDRWAIEDLGIPSIILMENAGRGVSEIAIEMLGRDNTKKAAVFCGIGNNGGDGLVAARYLLNKGLDIRIYIVGKREDLKPDPKINLLILERIKAVVDEISGHVKVNADLIIDAIFGIGLKDSVKEPAKTIIESLNRYATPILSIDVPSGLDADEGLPLGVAIRAKKTATLQFPKKGFYINEGPLYTGEVIVLDIGIPLK